MVDPTRNENASVIKGVSGQSMRVDAAQDLLNPRVSMPIIKQRGRWAKADMVIVYVEHHNHMV